MLNKERFLQVLTKYDLEILVASTPGNVNYSAGFRPPVETAAGTHQTFTVLPKNLEDIVLIIPQADIACYCLSNTWATEIEIYGRCYQYPAEKLERLEGRVMQFYEKSQKDSYETAHHALVSSLKKRGWDKCRIGLDELHMAPAALSHIARELPDAQIQHANSIFAEIRAIKTVDEINRLRESARLVCGSISAGISSLRPGQRETEQVSAIRSFLSGQNAVPTLWYVGVGKWSGLIDRESLSDAVVGAGDWVMFDIGCMYHGYYADIARSVILGPASQRQLKYYRAVQQGRQEAIEAIRPGVCTTEIFKIAIEAIKKEGIPHYNRAHIGHGIGCDFYELPSLRPDSPMTLQPGMVFCIETPYYELGWGGIQLEDTIVVTDTGVDYLSDLPFDLKVL